MSYYRRAEGDLFGNPLGRSFPPAVKGLLIANGVVFLLEHGAIGRWLVPVCWFSPEQAVLRLWVWQFVTYMFLHLNVGHVLLNMFTLWMFGRRLEQRWGTYEFLRFYLVCGVGAALVHTLATPLGLSFGQPVQVMLGASGAVYGVLLAYARYWAEDVVYVNFIFPVKIKYMVVFLGVVDFLGSIGELTGRETSSVAHFAHLGGLLTAWIYLRYAGRIRLGRLLRPRKRPARQVRAPRRPFFDEDTWR